MAEAERSISMSGRPLNQAEILRICASLSSWACGFILPTVIDSKIFIGGMAFSAAREGIWLPGSGVSWHDAQYS